jgi:hypothetical protein
MIMITSTTDGLYPTAVCFLFTPLCQLCILS